MAPLPTKFAPAERVSAKHLEQQITYLVTNVLMCESLNAVPDLVMILNHERQLVYANKALLNFLGISEPEPIYGLRPGEILGCIHSTQELGGCGTSEHCQTCGAIRAILTSHKGALDVQECRINQKYQGQALDLKVWATPIRIGQEEFTIFALKNIADEKRREVLEKTFFHKIFNTASNLKSVAHDLQQFLSPQIVTVKDNITDLSTKIMDEIIGQRQLLAAEHDQLEVKTEAVNTLGLINDVVSLYVHQDLAKDLRINVNSRSLDTMIISDYSMLRRILSNMLKNAIEASQPGDKVVIGCTSASETRVQFWVHNPAFMPKEVQLQIFQRSFSTKGKGRGLGTYSIKLLSEKYLQGEILFSSNPQTGTVFKATFPLVM
jgi:nitrogen-specific signal transduction histidine kinase